MSGEALIEITDLALDRGGRRVLDIAHLRVNRGRATLLHGDNGSGKTSLLKMLAGLLVASDGRFRCLGNPMLPRAAARFCRGRHIYLHQTPYMFDGTVEDNVAYGLGLHGRGRNRAQRRFEILDALAWAELDHLIARPALQLSTGEQQRVALVRARILAPALLLLDEITANMDSASRQRTHAMIADLERAGSSVILATHDPAAAALAHAERLELAAGRFVTPDRASPSAAVIPLHRSAARPDGN
jgi:tungstate transport system ATP-binding protein